MQHLPLCAPSPGENIAYLGPKLRCFHDFLLSVGSQKHGSAVCFAVAVVCRERHCSRPGTVAPRRFSPETRPTSGTALNRHNVQPRARSSRSFNNSPCLRIFLALKTAHAPWALVWSSTQQSNLVLGTKYALHIFVLVILGKLLDRYRFK